MLKLFFRLLGMRVPKAFRPFNGRRRRNIAWLPRGLHRTGANPQQDRLVVARARMTTGTIAIETLPERPLGGSVRGSCLVIDGDTIQIGTLRFRLAGIDAPELDHPWGKSAKSALMRLCKGQIVRAEISPEMSYDRLVATCYLPDGRDLSAEMVRSGHALDWPKFSGGKYSQLEPPDARKKHWKAAARQRGHMHIFNAPPPGQRPYRASDHPGEDC